MDKLRTTVILSLIVAMFITVAAACNQPVVAEETEPIQTQEKATYKVVPLITIHEGKDTPETESATEAITEPSESIEETNAETETTTAATLLRGEPMTLIATAYCGENYPHICNDGDATKTATGVRPKAGRTIAVDPRVIPYGSKVIINGNTYIAEDCGGAIKGNKRVDIFFDTHQEALQWGIRTVEAIVITEVTK